LLERREVDAALLVGSEGIEKLSAKATAFLQSIPTVILEYPFIESHLAASVLFTTAVYGVHREGTAYRMDEVPIPLREVLASPLPADHEILQAIMDNCSVNNSTLNSNGRHKG
jgi:formylmethanofuran dehydrogenase subunit B